MTPRLPFRRVASIRFQTNLLATFWSASLLSAPRHFFREQWPNGSSLVLSFLRLVRSQESSGSSWRAPELYLLPSDCSFSTSLLGDAGRADDTITISRQAHRAGITFIYACGDLSTQAFAFGGRKASWRHFCWSRRRGRLLHFVDGESAA
jgi:hypothetical protein